MASKSIIAREVKRAKLVAKYAAKRKALKEEGNWLETLSTTYAFRLYKINDTTHGKKAVSRDLLHGVLLIIQGAVRGECFRPSPHNIIATVQTSRG